MRALVMFDYDGVLVDSFRAVAPVFLAVCHQCGFTGIESHEHFNSMFEENFFSSLKSLGADEGTINTILSEFGKKTSGIVENSPMFQGTRNMLVSLSVKYPLYVITSNLSHVPLTVFQKHGIDSFQEVLGAEKEKSKIKKIQQTIEKHPGCTPYYIGDTKGDILEGREAGAVTVAVTWGWHTREKLAEGNPDYIIHSPKDLTDLLTKD